MVNNYMYFYLGTFACVLSICIHSLRSFFRQTYQVAYVIVKAANTPRPGNWILERSLDGVTYIPWQYYAISDSHCSRLYGVPPTRGIPHYWHDDDVICTSRYSKLNPLKNGEVSGILVNPVLLNCSILKLRYWSLLH